MDSAEKSCPKCHRVLPLACFPRDKTKSSGYGSRCGDCKKAAARESYRLNPEPKLKARAAYVEANYTAIRDKRGALQKTAEYKTKKRADERNKRAATGRGRLHDAHIKAWRTEQKRRPVLHDAHVRALKANGAEWFRWRYQNDPKFNLKERLRRQIRKSAEKYPSLAEMMCYSIERGCTSPTVRRVVGVTAEELRAHLERQFTQGMTWERFLRGEIHIDHIVPRAAFNLHSEADIAACWSLPNLRPAWAADNLAKSDKRVSLL